MERDLVPYSEYQDIDRLLSREVDLSVTWLLTIRKGECMYHFRDIFYTKLNIIVCYKHMSCSLLAFDNIFYFLHCVVSSIHS